jgi:peptidoglycan/LPS O-acetylase OafA/YrhL
MSAAGATPDALAPPPAHQRFPLLDGLRAVAVLCVVLVHTVGSIGAPDSVPSRLVLHLNIGVTIFFLISGFLLYRPFIAHRTGGPAAPAVGQYAKRRFLRIFPAYWLVLTVVLLLPSITATTGSWPAQYGLIFTMVGSTAWSCADCGLSQTWSLAVELTFYACLPLYVLAAARLARGRTTRSWLRMELALLAALSSVSILLNFVVYGGNPPALVGGSFASFWPWFALGMALAVVSVAISTDEPPSAIAALSRKSPLFWAAALVVYLTLSLVLPATPILLDVGDQLVAFLAFGLISLLVMIPAVLPGSIDGPRALLKTRPMAWLGLISYGVFLWHLPVVFEIHRLRAGLPSGVILVITLSISIAVAAASYYLLERPILKLKYSQRPRRGPASPEAPSSEGLRGPSAAPR